MLKMAWKGVLAHKIRFGLTAFAVVLGVAFIAASFVFTDRMSAAFDDLFEGTTDGVDVIVQEAGMLGIGTTGRVPDLAYDEVLTVDGVAAAIPSVQGIAQMIGPDGEAISTGGAPTLGFSILADEFDVSAVGLVDGRVPDGPGEVMIDVHSLESNQMAIGDTVQVITASGVEPFTIVGTISFGSADNLLGATMAAFEMSEAQRAMDMVGFYSQISVTAEPGVSAEELQARVEAAVSSPDLEVVLASEQLQESLDQIDTALGFMNTFFVAIGAIALFVAAFLISNTFRIIVSQRTRELAMLRAVGATGRQVTVLVMLEALIIGLVASIIGIVVGIGVAVVIQWLFDAIGISFPAGSLVVKPRTVVWGLVIGLGFTLVSAVIPAVRAARVPPVAALRETSVGFAKPLRKRLIAGTAITSVGLILLFAGLFGSFSNAVAMLGVGAGLTFVGVSVIAPFFSRGFGKVFGAPLPRMFGVPGRLAKENAIRKPRRMAATASALMIGVALVSIIAVLGSSARTTIRGAVEDEVLADFQVEASGFTDPTAAGVTPALKPELAEVDGVRAVSSYRIGIYLEPGSTTTLYLAGVDDQYDEMLRIDVPAGDLNDLGPGRAAIDAGWAEDEGLEVGDSVVIEPREDRPEAFQVVATYDAEILTGTLVLISMDDFVDLYPTALDAAVMVKLDDGVDADEIRPALEALVAEYPNVEMSDQQEYIEKTAGQVDVFVNILSALMMLAVLIALLGIMNTLALSIFERKREIGLLRAVGMTRRQVRRMIRWEAILIGVFGAVIGLIVGTGLAIAIVYGIGQGLVLDLPVTRLVIYAVLGGFGGFLASLWPARRGAKTDLLEAISFE